MSLLRLPLVRLVILERESTSPLIRTSLAADAAIAAGEQNAPQANSGQDGAADHSEGKRAHALAVPHRVHVECGGGVVYGCHRQRW